MEFTPWDELLISQRDRLNAADAVIEEATYLREAMNAKEITFEQALMALLIAELRNLPYASGSWE